MRSSRQLIPSHAKSFVANISQTAPAQVRRTTMPKLARIRANFGIVVLLTCAGAVWLIFATKLFAWLGISCRDDLIERNNRAALVGFSGAVLSAAIIYAGGSLGEGPSYSNNF